MNESSSLVLLNRASMLVVKGLVQDALVLLESAIKEFPFDPRPLERAAELYRGLSRSQDAVKALLAAADLYAQAGTPLRALDLCKRVLELDPQNSKAHRILKNAPPPRDEEEEFLFEESNDGATIAAPMDALEFDTTTVSGQLDADLEFESTSVTAVPAPDFDELTPTVPRKTPSAESLKKASLASQKKPLLPSPVKPPTQETPPTIPARPTTSALPATTRAVPLKKEDPTQSTPPPITPLKSPLSVRRSVYSSPNQLKAEAQSAPRIPSIPLFAELPPKAFREVLGGAQRRRFRAKEIICQEGENEKSCFIVLSGEVLVWKSVTSGRLDIARLNPGDFFGEMASLSQLPRSATVEATKDTEVFEIPWSLLSRLSKEHKPVEAVLHRFYKRRVLDNLALSSALFGSFSSSEREILVRSFVIKEVKPGERLLIEGVHANGFYVLLSAECEMQARNKQGRAVTIQKLRAGDYFGGGSILESRPALVTVQVTDAGRLLYLPRKTFAEAMQNHAEARAAVAPVLQERKQLVESVRKNDAAANGRIDMP